MALTTAQIQNAYVAFFNRPADVAGLNYWTNYNGSIADLFNAFAGSQEYKSLFTGQNSTQIVNTVYQNLFGRSPDVDGLNYWVGQLDSGKLTVANIANAVNAGALGADKTIISNKVAAATEFTSALDTTAEIVGYAQASSATMSQVKTWLSTVTDQASSLTAANAALPALTTTVASGAAASLNASLTTGQDNIVGTTGNDTFTARIFDNSNTLQSGDKIAGGGGNDILSADIGNSQKFAITAETSDIETVSIRAQAVSTDSTDNNTSATNEVQIDAQRMTGVTQWESNNSRADLLIEDVRILDTQLTKNITIAMVETDPGHVDYGVYFDQYSLRAQVNDSSVLRLQLMDTRSSSAGTGKLKDSPYNGFAFKLDGKLITVTSPAIDAAQTYGELRDAIEAAVKANPDLSNKFTVSLGSTYSVSDTLGAQQEGQEIVLTNITGGVIDASSAGTGWLANGAVPASSGLHTNMSTLAQKTTDKVTSKVILDDVGRGSTGGDLVIGGLSVGDTSTSLGVERFEIEVRDNSKLQTINSTNNTLQEVTIKNGATSSSSFAYVTTEKDKGDLTVNGSLTTGGNTSGGSNINTALPGSEAQHNAYGFSDVRLIDASTMEGNLAFTAEITDKSIAKYLKLADTQNTPSADNVSFDYRGGKNDDTMSVKIDHAVAGSTNTLTGREDFTFTFSGGAGNDNITIDIGDDETNQWYVDQKFNANITVDGGEGNDTIKTLGAGDIVINAGAGDDTVYADNSGTVGAAWVVAAANTDLNNLQTSLTNTGSSFLYKGKLTVTFSGAQADASGAVTAADAAALTNGWEVTVDVPTGDNYAVTQLHINQAIKKAINEDAVLSKLLAATDGPANTLVIKSLIDGNFAANGDDVRITVSAPDVTTLNASEQSTVLSAYKTYAKDSSATITTAQTVQAASVVNKNLVTGMDLAQVLATNGVRSTAESDNTINLGAGSDVVVLGTGVNSNDTLVFTGYDLGKKTIVNFTEAGAAVTGGDYLNFSSYLSSQHSPSGSTESTKLINKSFNADAIVEANSVTVLTGNFTATDTFAGLSAAKLLAAVNASNTGTGNYAGLTAGTLDAATSYSSSAPVTLVGGVGKAVVLVENNLNRGEYAAFELTFDGTSTNTLKDFSAAKQISVLDFGTTLTAAGISASATTLAPAIAGGTGTGGAGGGGTTTPTTPTGTQAATTVDGLGTDATPAALDANASTSVGGVATTAYNFTDNVATRGNVRITNFGADDIITISGGTSAAATQALYDSNISSSDADVQISYNNGGQLNLITLVGVNADGAFVNDVASFNALSVGNLVFA